ncbi:hypothetical protein F4680DRAFT_426350 [Xylaria scruposa]|nr:hypothetical protein F4680DRAFT_426350 [Xylaria scruposa]
MAGNKRASINWPGLSKPQVHTREAQSTQGEPLADAKSNATTPQNSLSRISNSWHKSIKSAPSFRCLKHKTISKDNTADENMRRSASFAYLGSRLTSWHDTSLNVKTIQAALPSRSTPAPQKARSLRSNVIKSPYFAQLRAIETQIRSSHPETPQDRVREIAKIYLQNRRNSLTQSDINAATKFEDIYGASVRLPIPTYSVYNKTMPEALGNFSTAMCPPVLAPHFSLSGQGNTMLYTPISMVDVDEGFDDFNPVNNSYLGGDFTLFPLNNIGKPSDFDPNLFR